MPELKYTENVNKKLTKEGKTSFMGRGNVVVTFWKQFNIHIDSRSICVVLLSSHSTSVAERELIQAPHGKLRPPSCERYHSEL